MTARPRCILVGWLMLVTHALHAAPLPDGWRNVQRLDVTRTGLMKFSVPPETLSAARSQFEDIRLFDPNGREVPFLLEQPAPPRVRRLSAAKFAVSLQGDHTVIEVETGTTEPISGIQLQSPAPSFLKAVRVESSTDQKDWRQRADGRAIFRQPNGVERMEVELPAEPGRFLRLSVDDRKSAPIPFTAAEVRVAAGPPAPFEPLGITIESRVEDPPETRLQLRAAAANVTLAGINLETPEALFMRPVTLSHPRQIEGVNDSMVLLRDSIYRTTATNGGGSGKTTVAAETFLMMPEIVLTIRNDDNPPLVIAGVSATRRPVYLVFHATEPGSYAVLSGNAGCAAPRYELAAMRANLPEAALITPNLGTFQPNPDFRMTDPLAAVPAEGAALDVSSWAFRKPVTVEESGWQQLELDLDVLAGSASSQTDLRLIRDGRQVPYLIERWSTERKLNVDFRKADDPNRPRVSRWRVELPKGSMPIQRLSCSTSTAYFERSVRLMEERFDDRGSASSVAIASATWVRRNEPGPGPLSLFLRTKAAGTQLYLEIENGDNPPLPIDRVEVSYLPVRILFKSAAGPGLFLYYGQLSAVAPSYDLSGAASRVLAAKRIEARLGREEILPPGMRRTLGAETANVFFWVVLAVVVGTLLLVVVKLLPKAGANS